MDLASLSESSALIDDIELGRFVEVIKLGADVIPKRLEGLVVSMKLVDERELTKSMELVDSIECVNPANIDISKIEEVLEFGRSVE